MCGAKSARGGDATELPAAGNPPGRWGDKLLWALPGRRCWCWYRTTRCWCRSCRVWWVGLWDCRLCIGVRHGRRRTVASSRAIHQVLLRYAPMEGSSVHCVVRGSCNSSTTYKRYTHGGGVKLGALGTPLLRSPGEPRSRAHIRGPEAERKGHPATRPPRSPDCCITCPKSRRHSTRYLPSLPTPPSTPRTTLSPPGLAP